MDDGGDDNTERELSREARRRRGSGTDGDRASSELLDLVRAAEDEARVATRPRSASIQAREARGAALPSLGSPAPSSLDEQFVEVGDDAVDAPPSLPPFRSASPAPPSPAAAPVAASTTVPSPKAGLPPVVGIALLFALVAAALALATR